LDWQNALSSEDWKIEYEQLSEDYRFFVQLAWQSQVAVLAVDGVLVGTVINIKNPSNMLGFVPLLGALLTITMLIQQRKWILRWKLRIQRLKTYDRMKGFGRFYFEESGFLKFPLEPAFPALMILVSAGLFVYAAILFVR
jgi:hypothetical protein